MTWLTLLLACAGPQDVPSQEGEAPPATTPAPVPAPTMPDTDTDSVPDPDDVFSMQVEKVGGDQLKVAFAAVAVQCEGDEAWIMAEYIGPATRIAATPILDVEGTPIELIPASSGVIRQTDLATHVPSCEEASWRFDLKGPQRSMCAVHGARAAELQAESPDCIVW